MSAPRPDARAVALRRLLRVDDGAFVARLGRETADAETARRASDYVAGVTRQRRWLDFLVGRFYRGDVAALDPPLREILRIGAYDLVVRGAPPHAAVGEAVALARRVLHTGAAGLANAVLRALARARADLPRPDTGDLADDLAVRHSHPTWLVRRWLGAYGREATERLLAHDNAAPSFALRVAGGPDAVEPLLHHLRSLRVHAERSPWLPDFVTVDRLQPVLRGGLVDDGRVAVQDVAAGLAVRALAPAPGEAILDAAAAPGGKAVYTALLQGAAAGQGAAGRAAAGRVVALDVSEAKTRLVAQAAAAHGVAGHVTPVAADLRTWDGRAPGAAGAPDGGFDAVLLDAPCSGTGVLAKRADLRWRRTEADLADLAALQDALLDAAARWVRPAGRLVYATCSLEPDENEHRVRAFLDRHEGWRVEPVGDRVPRAMQTADGFYAARPHDHQTDGAFAARLISP